MSGDTYVRIAAVLEAKTAKAVKLSDGETHAWVPRSCLHAATDLALSEMRVGDEAVFQIREWIAEREGIV